jgi:hypothetical protein
MGNRRLATMECGTLHQSFQLPECEAGGAQGSDHVRSVAFHRPGRRNNLRLRTRIFRLLLQESRLPMHSVPHKGGSRSPDKENDGAQTELAGASLFTLNGHSVARACHQTLVMRAPVNEVRWKPFPDAGQERTASHGRARIRSNMPDWHLCIVRQDYTVAALCERLRHGSIAPFIPLCIEVTT